MSKAKHQINDGYTSDPTSVKGWRDALPFDFQYRPALPEVALDYRINRQRAANGKAAVAAILTLLKPLIISWTKEADDGQPLPVDKESLRRTALPQLEEMVEYVTGYGDSLEEDAKN